MERRGLPRLALNNVTVRFKNLATNMFWARLSPNFQLHNLSKSGLSFSTSFPVKQKDKLLLKLCFANNDCIQLKGIVKWVNKNQSGNTFQVGVQFLPFGSHKEYNDLKSLEYLRKLLPNNSHFANDTVDDPLN